MVILKADWMAGSPFWAVKLIMCISEAWLLEQLILAGLQLLLLLSLSFPFPSQLFCVRQRQTGKRGWENIAGVLMLHGSYLSNKNQIPLVEHSAFQPITFELKGILHLYYPTCLFIHRKQTKNYLSSLNMQKAYSLIYSLANDSAG